MPGRDVLMPWEGADHTLGWLAKVVARADTRECEGPRGVARYPVGLFPVSQAHGPLLDLVRDASTLCSAWYRSRLTPYVLAAWALPIERPRLATLK